MASVFKALSVESGGLVDVPPMDQLKAMIAEADTDGDGKLNEAEFNAVIEACL